MKTVIDANTIGRPFNVVCRYENDRYTRQPKYNFYRRGVWVGGTSLEAKVLSLMRKFTESNHA